MQTQLSGVPSNAQSQGIQKQTSDIFRDSLSIYEKPAYDAFVITEGKNPKTMWELMQYSIKMQDSSKRNSSFYSEIFGF